MYLFFKNIQTNVGFWISLCACGLYCHYAFYWKTKRSLQITYHQLWNNLQVLLLYTRSICTIPSKRFTAERVVLSFSSHLRFSCSSASGIEQFVQPMGIAPGFVKRFRRKYTPYFRKEGRISEVTQHLDFFTLGRLLEKIRMDNPLLLIIVACCTLWNGVVIYHHVVLSCLAAALF